MTLDDVIAFVAICTDEDVARIIDALAERPVTGSLADLADLAELDPGWEDRAVERARAAGLFGPDDEGR